MRLGNRRVLVLGLLLAVGGVASAASADEGEGPSPLGFAGRSSQPPSKTQDDFLPIPDRWRIGFPQWERYPGKPGEYPYTTGSLWNPYNQNMLKGDYPIYGDDIFFIFTGVSDTLFEARRIPTPSNIPSKDPLSDEFFGREEQYFLNQNWVASMELFKGDSVYRPRDWEFRITPVFNINYVDIGELKNTDINPDQGPTRTDGHIGLQELFVEKHLADISPWYDFVSTRIGIQGFTSDFRGFIYSDNQLGARLFGNYEANRQQYNLAFFDQLEKDTNSGLNQFDTKESVDGRQQWVTIANYYRQDTIWNSYTASLSFHYNHDHPTRVHFDDNGFLVRPAVVGSVIPQFVPKLNHIDSYYLGWAGEGHIGRINVSHAFYQVLGEEDFNPIAGRKVDIDARFFALELSYDRDWLRTRAAFAYASGDSDATDSNAKGFDTIEDNTAFAGGGISYWQRQGIPFLGSGVNLVNRLSILPNLRSAKFEGQSNFVNPGLRLYNLGNDIDLTPSTKVFLNVSYLQFDNTNPLEVILEQRKINRNIGIDYAIGVQYRPLLIGNVVFNVGASALTPNEGFRQILVDSTLFSTFFAMTFTY
jgi:hypothetical protein